MEKKKITIISAVFFPRNSPRANRTTELAIELARQGHNVTVYAVLGTYNYEVFEKQHRLKVRNLGKMRFVQLNSDGEKRQSFLVKLCTKLLSKVLEFPDIEFLFKVPRILKEEKKIDLLITVAVPFPIHWGAAYAFNGVVRKNVNTWVADCGDPYMGNKFLKHAFYFKFIEKWFCRKVDYISIPVKEATEGYYKEFHDKIRIIPQGFNFNEIDLKEKAIANEKLTFIYAGAFYPGIRDPRPLLKYLSNLDIDFKFIIYTKQKNLVNDYKTSLGNKLEVHDYISRNELLLKMSQVDFLINFENGTQVQSPSKLIDYALSKRPILSVHSDVLNISEIEEFLRGDYSNKLVIENIEQYNIKNVANKFLELIK